MLNDAGLYGRSSLSWPPVLPIMFYSSRALWRVTTHPLKTDYTMSWIKYVPWWMLLSGMKGIHPLKSPREKTLFPGTLWSWFAGTLVYCQGRNLPCRVWWLTNLVFVRVCWWILIQWPSCTSKNETCPIWVWWLTNLVRVILAPDCSNNDVCYNR